MLSAPIIIIALLVLFSGALLLLQRRYPLNDTPLIDSIDALLPQTQCAQCHYPGCRPYAEAITQGEALNLCPPGGAPLVEALTHLMGTSQVPLAPAEIPPAVAFIDESKCIGCTLCLPPCPVDAILGAQSKMHTVLTQECTGCELCVPACPVDCITLRPAPQPELQFIRTPRQIRLPDRSGPSEPSRMTSHEDHQDKHQGNHQDSDTRACIQCGFCNPACPIDLPAQALLLNLTHNNLDTAADLGLANCIECELCDRVCPSDIPLAQVFADAKVSLAQNIAEENIKARFKARYDAHELRQQNVQDEARAKRRARLNNPDRWS